MEWKQCSGVGQPAISSGGYGRYFKAMCPICTKYVGVRIGDPCPSHKAVVINSKPPQETQRRST